jgi:hypothetical protein
MKQMNSAWQNRIIATFFHRVIGMGIFGSRRLRQQLYFGTAL